jgi:hypothetical protein
MAVVFAWELSTQIKGVVEIVAMEGLASSLVLQRGSPDWERHCAGYHAAVASERRGAD